MAYGIRRLTEHEASRDAEGEGNREHGRIITAKKISGGDAARGHTRTHPEHEG